MDISLSSSAPLFIQILSNIDMVLEQMDEESEAMSSEWRKLRSSLAVNKPLIPLKVTMFLIYGGKFKIFSIQSKFSTEF